MSRGNYSLGKRQREAQRARKKKEKAQKRQQRREEGPTEVEVTSADAVDEMKDESLSVEEVMQTLENQSVQRSKGASSPPCRLFVGGLSWDTTTATLQQAFGAYGEVVDAAVVKDRATGQSRGFGFVTLDSRKAAADAIDNLNESELDGRSIVVKIATERER